MSYTSLSEMRNAKSSLENLLKAAETSSKKVYENANPDVWSCKTDKLGNGSAVIRFLPAKKGESVPWAKMFTYGFKNPVNNRWYIENSPTTIGLPDPVKEYTDALYATKEPSKVAQAKACKRKLNYYANVLVVRDSENPEAEGKVHLFRFGQKIFDKIMLAMKPDNEGLDVDDWVQPFDPFNPFEGRNFNLKIKRVGSGNESYANFDDSAFSPKSKPLAETDEEIDAIWEQCKSLTAITATDKFKSYDDLKKRFDFVMGNAGGTVDTSNTSNASEIADSIQKEVEKAEKQFVPSTDDTDDDLAYFRSLAND